MLRKVASGFVIASLSVPVLGGLAAANVLVVAAGGGGNYTTIHAALAAAADGDTILVRTGNYPGFAVPDKTVSIVADGAAVVTVTGTASITSLAASHTIVLGGLRITGVTLNGSSSPALIVHDVDGPVRVQACSLTGSGGVDYPVEGLPAGNGAEIQGASTRVAFEGCTIRGGDWGECEYCDLMGAGGIGFDATFAARVALYDCTVSGGGGAFTPDGDMGAFDGGNGGDAAYISNGFLHASNSTLTGGEGGYVLDCAWGQTNGGDGGDGLQLFGANVGAWSIGSTFQPGAGSPHIVSGCAEALPGAPGRDIVGGSGTYFPLAGAELDMQAPSVVREGQDLVFTVHGQPGTLVELEFAPATQFTAIPSWRGVLLTRNPPGLHPSLYLGAIPASGVIHDGITVGDLPAGVASGQYFLQARGRGPGGRVLGSFAAVTVVDSAY